MRLLIDMQGCQTASRFRGIGRAARSIVRAMVMQADGDDIHLLLNDALPDAIIELRRDFEPLVGPGHIHTVALPARTAEADPANLWRNRAALILRDAYIDAVRPDIVFCTSFFEGFVDDAAVGIGNGAEVPVAATLQDLIPLMRKADYLDPHPAYKTHYMAKIETLKKSAGLLAISASAAQEAVDWIDYPENRVVNTSLAPDPHFVDLGLPDAERERLRAGFGIERPFVFYSGGADSRKNLDRLVAAFASLPHDVRDRHQLVFAGKKQKSEVAALVQCARDHGLAESALKLIGYVGEDDLVRLYNLAEVFVFPSLHEGFGLPALEALRCGTPVIASNNSSLPEVVGTRDALFDPKSVSDIAARLERVLVDRTFRDRLLAEGQAHAETFTWERSAEVALNALRRFARSVTAADDDWATTSARLDAIDARTLDALAAIPDIVGKPSDDDLVAISNMIVRNRSRAEAHLRPRSLTDEVAWRIEGPFDSSYSLAGINRNVARALDAKGHRVSLHSSEGPGDFDPDPGFLAKNPDLDRLHNAARAQHAIDADIVSRNMYPPRVADMTACVNALHNFAWEETGFPDAYAADINDTLAFVTVTSRHVKRVLINAGVSVPIAVVGNGIDHCRALPAEHSLKLGEGRYTFLHVSSCFPRKGVDVLLESYGRAFTASDPVQLVIKTFANPHNDVEAQLAGHRASNPDYPHVRLIWDDISDAQLKGLYEQADTLVAPSRAEGFGLPIAEALLSGLHVIATAWGGQMDFCDPDMVDLIDYRFARASTHLGRWNNAWVEPDAAQLTTAMRRAFERMAGRGRSGRAAQAKLLPGHSWAAVAERNIEAARRFANLAPTGDPRVGWVSTFNKKCGIAAYSQHLIDWLDLPVKVLAPFDDAPTAEDADNVERCWREAGPDRLDGVLGAVDRFGLDMVVIQFNYGFYDFASLAGLIDALIDRGVSVIATLHSTIDPDIEPPRALAEIAPALARCDRLLVHSVHDMNRLKPLGLVDNVALFPLGILPTSDRKHGTHVPFSRRRAITIGSYGFFLPGKGLLELIKAAVILRDRGVPVDMIMANAAYPDHISHALIEHAWRLISDKRLNDLIDLQVEFLSDAGSLHLLSRADVIVYPYQDTNESASAAVRHGLATGRPVAVTPEPIFDELDDAVFRLPGMSPAAIADGIQQIAAQARNRDPAFARTIKSAQDWRGAHGYPLLGRRLSGMLRGLHVDRRIAADAAGQDECKSGRQVFAARSAGDG